MGCLLMASSAALLCALGMLTCCTCGCAPPVCWTKGSAVLRVSVLCQMVLRWPSDPLIKPCLIISLVLYIIRVPAGPFVDPWASAGPTFGCRAATGPYAFPQASAGLHATTLASAGPPAATHSSAGARVPFAAPEPRPV